MEPFQQNLPLRSAQSSPPRQTVVVVDDDAKDLTRFTSLLEQMGYSVEAFASHREAEVRLEHRRFALVLLSLGSAVLEARRLLRLTLGRDKHTPVVVLTRWLEIEYYIEAMQLGAADFLEKPLSPTRLEHLVEKYCRSRHGKFSASCRNPISENP
jgi:DNA-binding NtrC family response regulator